jgi:hypothetical protein
MTSKNGCRDIQKWTHPKHPVMGANANALVIIKSINHVGACQGHQLGGCQIKAFDFQQS